MWWRQKREKTSTCRVQGSLQIQGGFIMKRDADDDFRFIAKKIIDFVYTMKPEEVQEEVQLRLLLNYLEKADRTRLVVRDRSFARGKK